jgi:hypothetical protein
MSLTFHTLMIVVYEKYDDVLIRRSLLFVRSTTCVKSIDFLSSKGPSIGSPLLFVRGATRVKTYNFC